MSPTTAGNPEAGKAEYVLKCMDIWSGNRSTTSEVSTPGLDLFVYSRPYRGQRSGGDVHYVSLCAGGVVTRMILADVAGHGDAVAETSRDLRSLMRRFMNAKSQNRLVGDLNREFSRLSQSGRFATAIVATYLSHRNRFMVCNAGHPRPLWHQQASGVWSYADRELAPSNEVANLPLGIDEGTSYAQLELPVQVGDIIVFYTDALTEARDPAGTLLREEGLLKLVQDLPTANLPEFCTALLHRISEHSADVPAEDDVTIMALKFTPRRRTPGVREKLTAYSKLLRLRPV